MGGAGSRAPDRAWNPARLQQCSKALPRGLRSGQSRTSPHPRLACNVASWLADLNVHADTSRQVLRHSESNTTMDYYTKTMEYYTKSSSETRRAAIQALDQSFNG